MTEIINGSTSAAKCIARLSRAALRNIGCDIGPGITKCGKGIFIPIQLGTIKRAIDPRKFRIIEIRLVVTPECIVIIAFNPRVDTARRRRILFDNRIVPVSRIITIWIETAQQLAEILIIQRCREIADSGFARVCCCGDGPTIIQTRADIKCDAALVVQTLIPDTLANRSFDLRDVKDVS